LFVAMEQLLKKCTQFSKHQTLFEVFLAFQRILDLYSGILEKRLPSWLTQSRTSPFTDEMAQCICAIVGTTEVVDATLTRLQEMFETTIDPAFKVSFDSNLDTFGSLTTKAFQALVQLCENALEPSIVKMNRSAWDQLARNEESPYISDVSKTISAHFTKVFRYLSHLHFRFFCDKFAEMFIPKFVTEALKIKSMMPGAEQRLKMDTAALKTVLLEIPVVVASGQATSTAYSNFVVREMDKAEELLENPVTISALLTSKDTIQDYAQRLTADFSRIQLPSVSVPDGVSSSVSDVKRKLGL